MFKMTNMPNAYPLEIRIVVKEDNVVIFHLVEQVRGLTGGSCRIWPGGCNRNESSSYQMTFSLKDKALVEPA